MWDPAGLRLCPRPTGGRAGDEATVPAGSAVTAAGVGPAPGLVSEQAGCRFAGLLPFPLITVYEGEGPPGCGWVRAIDANSCILCMGGQ